MDENNWLGVQAAGGTMSAISAFMGVIAQRQSLRNQADIAEINAAAAERNAQQALMIGQRREQASRLSTANLKARQTVGYAARGIDLGEGSAAQVLASTDIMGEIDANTIAANAVREAWGIRAESTNYSNQARTQRAAASALSPALAAGTSLLNSAGTVSERWYLLNKAGYFDKPTALRTPSDPPTSNWGL